MLLAQSDLGIAIFTIESAGETCAVTLTLLKGVERPDDDEDATVKDTDD